MGTHFDFADGGDMKCPRCGYASDSADFAVKGGTAGTSDPAAPDALRTPAGAPNGSGAMPLTVRGASSPSMGLANRGQRSVNLARRMPVQQPMDLIVHRVPGGPAVVRHRMGGNEVGKMHRNDDGTWSSEVGGKMLSPHTQQRNALLEMVGQYNSATAAPLQPPPVQTPMMGRLGIPAIRLASDPDDDGDDDDSTTGGDTDNDYGGNPALTPRGKAIYKKLIAKGMKPAVALAMAKRAQNTKPGQFGNAKAS